MIFGRFNYNTTRSSTCENVHKQMREKENIIRYQHSHDSQLSVGGDKEREREKSR
jgi:hypothetical protein